MQSLRQAGYSPYFYDIDCHRPKFEEVVKFFTDRAPDMVMISAVVSTAYSYTKRLALVIKDRHALNIKDRTTEPSTASEQSMQPLRDGR